MINRLLLLFALLLPINSFSTPIKIKGTIKDAKSGTPISFVNIAIIELEKGTTSNFEGYFELEVDSDELNNTVNFSCLNFKSKRVQLSKLSKDSPNEILMESLSYEISEIVITPEKSKKKEIVLNELKKSAINGLLLCDNLPKMYARYFPFETRFEGVNTIQSVNIGFRGDQQKHKSKVRIRFFSNDTQQNSPNEDILHEELIISTKSGINNIDVSKYNIKIPKEGIYVAVEWLIIEDNKYNWTTYTKSKTKKVETKYGPILGANYATQSSTWLFWAGNWEKYEKEVPVIHPKIKPGSYFDSAISITLTN